MLLTFRQFIAIISINLFTVYSFLDFGRQCGLAMHNASNAQAFQEAWHTMFRGGSPAGLHPPGVKVMELQLSESGPQAFA